MGNIRTKELRSFAFIWSGIFIVIAFFPLMEGKDLRSWSLGLSIFFAIIGVFRPVLLKTFYVKWIKIGEFIGNIISKVIMVVIFFGLFTPISLTLKILRKDPLKKKIDKKADSYWIQRETQPGALKNQF